MNKLSLLLSVILLMVVYACDYAPACMPVYLSNSFIYPDYSGVTIPRNIASLSFRVGTEKKEVKTIFHTKDYSVTVKGKEVVVPIRKWKKLLRSGEKVQVDILVKERAKWEPFYLLNSSYKCNGIHINNLFKFFVWCEVSKSFTRSII